MARRKFVLQMLFDGRGAPAAPAFRPQPETWRDDGITGSVLGHSTVLLNFLGCWILTDPVFSRRVGPGLPPLILGPKRHLEPALRPREFPAPEVLVLSHAHFDHLDRWSLRQFSRRIPVVTAARTGDLLRSWGFRAVHELRWGESIELPARQGAVRITGLEVRHWGARMLRDDHRGYNGYLLEREGRSVCFAGDTAFTPAFSGLRQRGAPVDLMLLPIGAYDPWIHAHCSPEQAVEMARQAGAQYLVPTHHETFRLSSEPMTEPLERLRAALAREPGRLLAEHVGQTFHVPPPGAGVSGNWIQNEGAAPGRG